MKRVYIAGPYSSPDFSKLMSNIGDGIAAARTLLIYGIAPFCPWLDHQIAQVARGTVPTARYYEANLEWLKASEAVLVIGDHEASNGTTAEIKVAEELGIPVFYDFPALLRWAKEAGRLRYDRRPQALNPFQPIPDGGPRNGEVKAKSLAPPPYFVPDLWRARPAEALFRGVPRHEPRGPLPPDKPRPGGRGRPGCPLLVNFINQHRA